MCNTSSAYHVQHNYEVAYHVVRRDNSAIQFDRVEIAFILAFILLAEQLNRRRRGGNRSTRSKPLATSFRKCHILRPKDSSPKRDSNPHNSIGGRQWKADMLTVTPRVARNGSVDVRDEELVSFWKKTLIAIHPSSLSADRSVNTARMLCVTRVMTPPLWSVGPSRWKICHIVKICVFPSGFLNADYVNIVFSQEDLQLGFLLLDALRIPLHSPDGCCVRLVAPLYFPLVPKSAEPSVAEMDPL